MSSADILLRERYLREDEDYDAMCRRVAEALGDDMRDVGDFYHMMKRRRALPSSPVLMNAGTGGFMSACSFLPIRDDMKSIMKAISMAVQIQKMGGGVGFNFSSIRPAGSPVKGTGGVASGPCSFIRMYDACSDVVRQGGKRRGANMALLHWTHKDIHEFIHLKEFDGLSNFNLSVILDDQAMTDAELLREIATQIWMHGEPGVVFWDRVLQDEPRTDGINPCGEIPLRDYESCVLGSVNLYEHVDQSGLDLGMLNETVKILTRMLNRVIDKNNYPFRVMETAAHKTSKIGIGLMGFADTLYALGIEYGSDECMEFIDSIMECIGTAARDASEGNMFLLSIAPTGSISIIADVSSGIEPVFSLQYRIKRENACMIVTNRAIRDMHIDIERPPTHFVTAREIAPEVHIAVQARFQQWVDQAISKTINLPESTSIEDIVRLLHLGYESGLKGLTMFRENCARAAFLEVCPTC